MEDLEDLEMALDAALEIICRIETEKDWEERIRHLIAEVRAELPRNLP